MSERSGIRVSCKYQRRIGDRRIGNPFSTIDASRLGGSIMMRRSFKDNMMLD